MVAAVYMAMVVWTADPVCSDCSCPCMTTNAGHETALFTCLKVQAQRMQVLQRMEFRSSQVHFTQHMLQNRTAMQRDDSAKGAMLKLNMGQGKTYAILPMIILAAAGKDDTLLRLNFPAELLPQASSELQAMLTGATVPTAHCARTCTQPLLQCQSGDVAYCLVAAELVTMTSAMMKHKAVPHVAASRFTSSSSRTAHMFYHQRTLQEACWRCHCTWYPSAATLHWTCRAWHACCRCSKLATGRGACCWLRVSIEPPCF